MPINSNLIQGAQSLFVRTDLKFGNTTISGVFSEQSLNHKNSFQGGRLQEFNFFALITRKIDIFSLVNILEITMIYFFYPYINSVQITYRSLGHK